MEQAEKSISEKEDDASKKQKELEFICTAQQLLKDASSMQKQCVDEKKRVQKKKQRNKEIAATEKSRAMAERLNKAMKAQEDMLKAKYQKFKQREEDQYFRQVDLRGSRKPMSSRSSLTPARQSPRTSF